MSEFGQRLGSIKAIPRPASNLDIYVRSNMGKGVDDDVSLQGFLTEQLVAGRHYAQEELYRSLKLLKRQTDAAIRWISLKSTTECHGSDRTLEREHCQ